MNRNRLLDTSELWKPIPLDSRICMHWSLLTEVSFLFHFPQGFYLYLYIGSMVFLLFMYTTLLWGRPKTPLVSPVKSKSLFSRSRVTRTGTIDHPWKWKPTFHIPETPTKAKIIHRASTTCSTDSGERSDSEDDTVSSEPKVMIPVRRMSLSSSAASRIQHFGSFYLRMGAVGTCPYCERTMPDHCLTTSNAFLLFSAFGIGSMIYSGLEFGQYFELERDTKCHNVLLALTPATRMAFIFIQMYFIFLNNEVRLEFLWDERSRLAVLLWYCDTPWFTEMRRWLTIRVWFVFCSKSKSTGTRFWLASDWCTWSGPICRCGSRCWFRKPNTRFWRSTIRRIARCGYRIDWVSDWLLQMLVLFHSEFFLEILGRHFDDFSLNFNTRVIYKNTLLFTVHHD